MALESGFFNSVNGDRLYNARDMSRYFENILSSGIFKRITDCFKVSAGEGMNLTIAPGAGLIDCQWFRSNAAEIVTIPTANAVLPRFDTVVARLDLNDEVRAITLMVVSGEPADTPIAPEPVRTTNVHDLVLALVYVPAAATSIVEANLTDVRANDWYCGYVRSLVDTPVLNTFNSRYAVAADNVTTVPIDVVGFDPNVDIVNVYVNGFRIAPGVEYILNVEDKTVTLAEAVDAGTLIDFEVFRPVQPDDIATYSDTITTLLTESTEQKAALTNANAAVSAMNTQVSALAGRVSTLETNFAKVAPITAGDFNFGEAFIVTGFASSESTRVYFSIPFNRPIVATTATVKKMEVAARQSESYVLGSASSFYDIAKDIISTRLSKNGMLTIVAAPTFTIAPFNNAEVSFYINTSAVVTFA